MRLVSFPVDGGVHMGVISARTGADTVLDVTSRLAALGIDRMEQVVDLDGPALPTLSDLLKEDPVSLPQHRVDRLRLLPPVTSPSQMLFIRSNYPAPDGTRPQLSRPAMFSKVPSSLLGHNGTILLPAMSGQVDWEAELAVIIGRHASFVAASDAFDHVAGYTINNDITARDLQAEGEPALAKNFRTFSPLGPWIVTADEIQSPGRIGIKQWVNDHLFQDGNTRDMVFSIPEIIAYLSSVTDLHPGDVIATGSPAGIGRQQDPPIYMTDGDVLRVEVEGVGVLVNSVSRSS